MTSPEEMQEIDRRDTEGEWRRNYVQEHNQEFNEWCAFNNKEVDCPDSEDEWMDSIEQEMDD